MSSACAMLCAATLSVHAQTYHLAQTRDAGDNLTLRIMEDSRLKPAIAKKMWGTATDPAFVFGADSPVVKKMGKTPLLPAKLVLADSAGKVLASLIPEDSAPLAQFQYDQLPAGFLIATDDSAGMGSYSGIQTRLISLVGGTIAPIMATDENGKSNPIILSNTLKAQWRIIGNGGSTKILQIRCDPDFAHEKPGSADLPFVISYLEYRYGDAAWHLIARREPGFWEDDQDFPENKFP
jgi:hypothetical protein